MAKGDYDTTCFCGMFFELSTMTLPGRYPLDQLKGIKIKTFLRILKNTQ